MLVKLEFIDGTPLYVNPDRVVSLRMSEDGQAAVINLLDDRTGWLLRGDLEDIAGKLNGDYWRKLPFPSDVEMTPQTIEEFQERYPQMVERARQAAEAS